MTVPTASSLNAVFRWLRWGVVSVLLSYAAPAGAQTSSTGTGLLLSDAGIVVTNHHVVDNADRIEVAFADGRLKFEASVLMKDTGNDLAILRLQNFDSARWADQKWFAVGDHAASTTDPASHSVVTCPNFQAVFRPSRP